MKNIYYAIISTLLVTFLLFTIYYNVDLFHEQVIEGNVNRKQKQIRKAIPQKSRTEAKAEAKGKPARQLQKRTEKQVCLGSNCDDWGTNNQDIPSEMNLKNKMDDMKYAMHYDTPLAKSK
jgi:hypothetical protein